MKHSIQLKLENLCERYDEIAALLSEPEVQGNQNKFRTLSQEYAQIGPLVDCYKRYEQGLKMLASAKEMANDNDPELRELAKEEINEAEVLIETLDHELQVLLLPKDPNDIATFSWKYAQGQAVMKPPFFQAIFPACINAMPKKKAGKLKLSVKARAIMAATRKLFWRVSGRDVYSQLKFESGAHRVQRVPETESQGRIHTSACTVAIMPEVDEVDAIDINPADLKVDTYRASGAGGQHINKTESAIRITHIPSGVVVECQDERSQHKNRARAMSLLASVCYPQNRKNTMQNNQQPESCKSVAVTAQSVSALTIIRKDV